MKDIIVMYYRGEKLPNLPYNHKESYPLDDMGKIITKITDAGYNVMVTQGIERLQIWIDKYRFQQR